MSPSQRQLRALTPQDRALYMRWLRQSLLLYGSAGMLLAGIVTAVQVLGAQHGRSGTTTLSAVAISRQ